MRRLTASQKTILLQWLQIVGGLAVFAFGVHLTIFANIGLAPWDCLGMGISYHTPLNYGLSSFRPSGQSTSRSKSRPSSVRSSKPQHSALSDSGDRSTTYSPSQPVSASTSSR